MADYIEIVLTAVDLASGKIQDANGKISKSFRDLESRGSALSGVLDQLHQKFQRLQALQNELNGSSRGYGNDLKQIEQGTKRLELTTGSAAGEIERMGNRLSVAGRKSQDLDAATSRSVSSMRAFGRAVGEADEFVQGHVVNEERLRIAYNGAITERDNDTGSMRRWGGAARTVEGDVKALGRGVADTTEKLVTHDREVRKKKGDYAQAEQGAQSLFRTLGTLVGGVGLLTSALYLGGNAVGAFGGSAVALISSLSSLAGLLSVIPAGLVALGGTLAAVSTIFAPAVSGISDYIAQVEKVKDTPITGSSKEQQAFSAQDHAQGIKDAEQSLSDARRNGVQSVADAERNLFQLRRDNAWQMHDLEQRLDDARRQGVQTIIDLEKQLHDLRMRDRIQEQDLQQSLADAQASAAGEQARGGQHVGLAQAAVVEAQRNLDQFNRDRARNEGDLEQRIADARLANAEQIKQIETEIFRTRIHDTEQVRAAEEALGNARIQAVRAVRAAEEALARARRPLAPSGQNAQLEQLQAMFAQLTPLQQRLALGIIALKNRWEELNSVTSARDGFLRLALRVLDQINGRLPVIANTVAHFARVLTALGNILVTRLFAPAMFNRLNRFANEQATNMGIIGRALINFGQAIAIIATSSGAREFLRWLSLATLYVSRLFGQMIRHQDASDGFQHFFEQTRRVVTDLAKIFNNLGHAIFDIFRAGTPAGNTLLDTFVRLSVELRRFTGSARGQREMREFFRNAVKSAEAWGKAIGVVLGLLTRIVVLTTNTVGPIQLLADTLDLIASTPLGNVVGAMIGLVGQFFLLEQILPGNQRLVQNLFHVFQRVFGTLIPFALKAATIEFLAFDAVVSDGTLIVAAFGTTLEIALAPFLLIVAIAAIVIGALVLMYVKWKWFHDAVDFIANKLWDALTAIFGGIKDTIVAIWDFIVNAITRHWQALLIFFLGPAGILIDVIVNHWNTIKHAVVVVWDFISGHIKSIWNDLVDFFNGHGGNRLVSAFQSVWDDVAGVVRDSVGIVERIAAHFVNLIVDGVNFILKLTGAPKSQLLPHVHWGEQGSQTQGAAGGGGRKHATGGWEEPRPGGKYMVAEGGYREYILTTDPKHRNRQEWLMGRYMKETGWIPKFARGGVLDPAMQWLANYFVNQGGTITSTTGGQHAPNSYHYKGEAIDIAPSGQFWNELYPRDRAFVELFGPSAYPHGGLYHYGRKFSDSALQAEHQNHIHVAFTGSLSQMERLFGGKGGISVSGAIGSALGGAKNAVVDVAGFVLDHIPGLGSIHKLTEGSSVLGHLAYSALSYLRSKVIGLMENLPGLAEALALRVGGGILSGPGQILSGIEGLLKGGDHFGGVIKNLERARQITDRSPSAAVRRAFLMSDVFGWDDPANLNAWYRLWEGESGWRWNALNSSSGAYGIPQSLPADKMASAGADWRTNPFTQILWGASYIKGRYGSPSNAYRTWLSRSPHWYAGGGEIGQMGEPVPIVAHVGEWVLNTAQQYKLAQVFGGWDNARRYLFTTASASPHRFSMMRGMLLPGGGSGVGTIVNQQFDIKTQSPKVDVDYVMRQAEMHMRAHA